MAQTKKPAKKITEIAKSEQEVTTNEADMTEPQILTFGEAKEFAVAAYKSGLFPDAKSEAQAIIKVWAGRELGISPLTALNKLYLVQDKIGMAAEVVVILLCRNGYQISINYDNYDSPTACEVILSHTLKGNFTSRFSLTDAQRAGLIKPGSAWQKYPRDLLYARALTSGARKFAPEVLGGMGYTQEELVNITPLGDKPGIKSVAPSSVLNVETMGLPASESPVSESIECSRHSGKFFKQNKWGTWTHPTDEKNEKGKTVWCYKDRVDRELVEEKATTPASKPTEPKTGISVASHRDPSTIKNFSELYKACFNDFGLQPKEVLAELNVTTSNEIVETMAECYIRIKAVRQ